MRSFPVPIRWLSLLVLCAAAPSPAFSQSLTSGGLTVAVADSLGRPLSDARVAVRERTAGMERAVATRAAGRARVDGLPVGEYDVLVERVGYRPARVLAVAVRPAAAVELAVTLRAAGASVTAVDTLAAPAALLRAGAAGVGGWVAGDDLRSLPGSATLLDAVSRFSTSADEALEVEGLPAHLGAVYVDGQAVSAARSPAPGTGALRAAALPLGALSAAELLTHPLDVELAGTAGAVLSAHSATGARELRAGAYGSWASGAPGLAAAGDAFDELRGGALLSGSLVPDTVTFVVGVETRRDRLPLSSLWAADSVVARIADIARSAHTVSLRDERDGQPLRSEAVSAFGRLDWQLSDAHRLAARAHFAELPSVGRDERYEAQGGTGGQYAGQEISVGVLLASRLSERVRQEGRVGYDRGEVELSAGALQLADGDGAADLPPTSIGVGGMALAIGGERARLLRESSLRITETLFFDADPHQLKLGLAADFSSYEHSLAGPGAGEFLFSGLQGFASGLGVFAVAAEPAGGVSFEVPRFSAFAQDRWTAAPGLTLTLGTRYDVEKLPLDQVIPNLPWAEHTGLNNAAFPGVSHQFGVLGGATWDVGARGRWLVRAAGGLHAGQVDPALLAEALGRDMGVEVRRGAGALGRWPALDGDDVATTAPTITLLAPATAPPRTARATLSLGRALGAGALLTVSGTYRRTDRLARRSDLNLLATPAGADQHGRPIFGNLAERGGLLAVSDGSNRRFTDFDQVWAVDGDGWSTYRGVTLALEARPSATLALGASYTASETRDNLPGFREGANGVLPDPFPGAATDWREGRSDLDVPHRVVATARWAPLPSGRVRLAALYRFRSGYPFTPGFQYGVDANGDGSWRNDPAFVDAGLPGVAEALGRWGCLGQAAGAFVTRNACRTPGLHALDLRLELDLFRAAGYRAALSVDGANLLASEAARVDPALYLVRGALPDPDDPTLTRVDLVANPDFGQPVVGFARGRALRIGFRVEH